VPSVDPLAFLAAALEAAAERAPEPEPKHRGRAPGAEDEIDADDKMPWRRDAACRSTDPDIFFPNLSIGSKWDRDDYADALAICRVCDVVSACLDYALANREDDGVWGGTDPYTRRLMLRTMGGSIAAVPDPARGAEPGAVPVELALVPTGDEPTDAELAELEADAAFDDLFGLETDDPELMAS
jgi:WhiB family redox-sensing transcriptional regulator